MDEVRFPAGFRHDALLYEEDDEFLAGTVPFVRDGVEAGEPVMVVVEAKLELMRGELGADAEGVEFLDMREAGRNPARLIPCGAGSPIGTAPKGGRSEASESRRGPAAGRRGSRSAAGTSRCSTRRPLARR